jgi:hypothetical protein
LGFTAFQSEVGSAHINLNSTLKMFFIFSHNALILLDSRDVLFFLGGAAIGAMIHHIE